MSTFRPVPGTHKTVLASSADAIKINANLRKIGLPTEEWVAAVTGEDVERRKPEPDIFLFAAHRLSLQPGQCVVVEDAVNGIWAAKAAGMRCVAVAQAFPAVRLHDAELVRKSVADLNLSDLTGRKELP